jgi:hypothetical protein
MQPTALGIAAHMGWLATALVTAQRHGFATLRTDRIVTVPPGDRLALEPFHVAGGFDGLTRVPPPRDPEATVRDGLARQQRHALEALREFIGQVERGGGSIQRAVVLTGRGRPAPDIARALSSHARIHIEEGLAARSSVRDALHRLGIETTTCDARSVPGLAASALHASAATAWALAMQARPPPGHAWRKEHQLAALGAWLALVADRP